MAPLSPFISHFPLLSSMSPSPLLYLLFFFTNGSSMYKAKYSTTDIHGPSSSVTVHILQEGRGKRVLYSLMLIPKQYQFVRSSLVPGEFPCKLQIVSFILPATFCTYGCHYSLIVSDPQGGRRAGGNFINWNPNPQCDGT